MQFKSTKTLKYLPLIGIVHGPLCMAVTNDMAGTWSSVTLSGNLDTVSPALRDFRWQIINQARTRDDSSEGMRLSENLLFGQLGYALDRKRLIVSVIHNPQPAMSDFPNATFFGIIYDINRK